ncbi:MAG: hypothetical protein AOA66_0627 [Candidatus Bathyarchaeota archaeon BA2]|nr:MAG: hypothetical protein AOA66_0627 [Candidatus Bathyarchaeota archaeon BA2]
MYLRFREGGEIVPQQVICQKCGFILYDGLDLKPPDEVIQSHDGKCPNCGKKLSFIPKNVEVKPVNETSRLGP